MTKAELIERFAKEDAKLDAMRKSTGVTSTYGALVMSRKQKPDFFYPEAIRTDV